MATWRRITGVAGLAAGAVAAGAGAVVAAERIAIGRAQVLRNEAPPEKLGELRGRVLTVLTDDGVPLHVEIDEPDPDPATAGRRRSSRQARPLTIIFCHGYTLNQDCWHFQRAGLGRRRLVFWDQRDHGRSGRSPAGPASIDRLGADLGLVIKAVAPGDVPVILVGHSMGGMTIMALAGQHPELFGTKVVGAALMSTAASGLDGGSPWMPGVVRPLLRRTLPVVLRGAATGYRAMLVEHGRRVATDLSFLSTRFIGFGDPQVNPALVDFLEQMIRSTPIEVVAAFGDALYAVDMRGTLAALSKVPVVVLTGDKDRLIPPELGLELAAEIPGAEMVWVPGAGHALILENPEVVNEAITGLIARVGAGLTTPERSA
ncbi:MAG TPA: alpha/beta hydrolase [Streptosporangiaceae bacterium]|nr:alpha/beta hydrolase [Streptosporangiaceae bacterium]